MSISEPRRIALADPLRPRDPLAAPRFVVAGQASQVGSGDVRMYEWNKESGQMSMLGLQSDVGAIRAVAWSPLPTHRSLLAVGQSTGHTQLHSLSSSTLSVSLSPTPTSYPTLSAKHARPVTSLAFSPVDPTLLAVGLDRHRSDYSLLIWDISDLLSRIPADPNDGGHGGANEGTGAYGAAGWKRQGERLDVLNPLARDNMRPSDEPRHIQHYCPSENVNSVAWFNDTIFNLYASANGKSIRIYDLRAPAPVPSSSGPTSATVPGGSGSASGSNLRDPYLGGLQGVTSQWNTRAVNGLSVDPFHSTRFASYESTGTGSTVKVWDNRRAASEVASFPVVGAVIGLQWSQTIRGSLSVGSRETGVSVWDVVSCAQVDGDELEEWTTIGGMRQIVKPRQPLHSFALAPSESAHGEVMFVLKNGTIGIGPTTPSPVIATSARGELAVSSSSLSVLDPEQPLRHESGHTRPSSPTTQSGPHAHFQTPAHSPSPAPRAAPTTAPDVKRNNRFQLAPDRVAALLAEESHTRSRSTSPASGASSVLRSITRIDRVPEREAEEEDEEGEMKDREGAKRILKHDIGYTMRRRAEEGYGLNDLLLNAAIASRHTGHERMAGFWEFLEHFLQIMSPHLSSHEGVDLTYQGIWPVWVGPSTHAATPRPSSPPRPSAAWTALRAHPGVSRPSSASGSGTTSAPGADAAPTSSAQGSGAGSTPRKKEKELEFDPAYNTAISTINAQRAETGHIGAPGGNRLPHTERAPQRRMILALCGENHNNSAMAEINRLIADDQRTKAACWAFFASEEEPAISILMKSDDERHRLMGATVAGFMTQARAERGSQFWQEHWPSMVSKVDDPYVRAILCRIAGDDWDPILYDESLPLLDRVAIAVCNLNDKDLTVFFRNRLNRCITLGSLHGLCMTGLNSSGLQLLQRWLDRTSDVQSAAIISGLFPRSRLSHAECTTLDRWRDEYRDLMDGWKAWVARCALDSGFDMERRRLGEEGSGVGVVVGLQTVVVCPVCNNLLTKQTEEHLIRKNALRGTMNHPTARTTACMYCQTMLPRCCICLQHVRPENDHDWVEVPDSVDSAYVSCQTCRHGGHAAHILGWFEGGLDGEPGHEMCPVAGCSCRCASL